MQRPFGVTYRLTVHVNRYGDVPTGARYVRDVDDVHTPRWGDEVVVFAEDGTTDGDGPFATVRRCWFNAAGLAHIDLVPFDVDPTGAHLHLIRTANETDVGGWTDSNVWFEATDGDLDGLLTVGGWRRW